MNSSGIKRGLATTAISALAVTGLPFFANQASAVPVRNTVTANAVEIANPESATASTKNDGQDTTIRLEAVGGTNVTSVRFSYTISGGSANTIDTVTRNDDGAFSLEWAAAGLNGAAVVVTATALDAGGTATGGTSTQSFTISSTAGAVNINNGSALGYFAQTYTGHDDVNVSVSGTSSEVNPTPSLFYWVADNDGGTLGNQPGYVAGGTATSGGATAKTWSGVLNIDQYDLQGTPDELLVRATQATDDAESFTLYKQTISTVTATADSTSVQAGDEATVTVTVKDQSGLPIVGAEVRRSDESEPKYTDSKGQVTYAQGAGSDYYYANTSDSDPYEAELGDKRSETVTIAQYDPAETSLDVTSRDGAAFDEDEFSYTATAPGLNSGAEDSDIVGQITDQNGNAIEEGGRTVTYRWVVTPFEADPTAPASDYTETGTVLTDDEGKFSVDAPSIAGDDDGKWELFVTLEEDLFGEGGISESKELEVLAGDSTLAFTESSPEQATSGTSEDVTGSLTLADGTGLAGRKVTVTYDNGATGDANIVQEDGTTGATRTVTTDADGNFSVTVKDPAVTPNQPEEDGVISASTIPGTVDNDDPDEDTAGTQEVSFVETTTPGALTLTDTDGSADETPGELASYEVHVTDGATSPTDLSNQEVTLTTDHGYFTDGDEAPAPVVGADAGTYKDLGQTTTVTTDENGEATIFLAMKRDEGFDDDGLVDSTVTATIGSLSDTETQGWDSSNPLNGGEVRLEFSPADEQTADNLPQAQVGEEVSFEVYTTDQFQNLVGGEEVTLTDNQSDAAIEGENDDASVAPGYQVLSDFDNDGDFVATSEEEQDQTITGSWTTDTLKYSNVNGTTVGGSETLTDSETVEWYAVDFAASTFTLTSDPEGPVPVNTAVTETVKVVDQEGNPVQGLEVEFIRTGPGSQPGESVTKFTNANGEAFYTFVGSEVGTANINVAVTDGEQVETLSDTVEFTGGKINAGLTLRGGDNGAADDSLFANAHRQTEGAVVKLFRKKADGTWKFIRSGIMNAEGNFRFKNVADKNGNKVTKYKAIVKATDDTRRGVGKKSVR